MTGPPGCGRCAEGGHIEIAHHRRRERDGAIVVECRMVDCDCERGSFWRARRAQRDDGGNRVNGYAVGDYAAILRDRADTIAVYVDPTPAQRRAALTEPNLTPEGEAKVRAIIDAIPRARPAAPPPAWAADDRW